MELHNTQLALHLNQHDRSSLKPTSNQLIWLLNLVPAGAEKVETALIPEEPLGDWDENKTQDLTAAQEPAVYVWHNL